MGTVGSVMDAGATTVDCLARELSRVTMIVEHFLTDIENGEAVPDSVRFAATMARHELDGQTVER